MPCSPVMDDARRLKLFRLVERVRTVEHRQSALTASTAMAERNRLDEVHQRIKLLSSHYSDHGTILAGDLQRLSAMRHQLQSLEAAAGRQADDARVISERSRDNLVRAENRLRRVEEKRSELTRAVWQAGK